MPDAAKKKAVYTAIELLSAAEQGRGGHELSPELSRVRGKISETLEAIVTLFEQQRVTDSKALALQLLSIAPENPEIYNILGRIYLELFQDAEGAIGLLYRYVDHNKEDPEVWALLCDACYHKNRLEESVKAGEEALRLGGGGVSVYITLAQAAYGESNFDTAESYNRKGLALDPFNIVLLKNLGEVLQAQGKKDEAVAHYREALERQPHLYEGYMELIKLEDDDDDSCFMKAAQLAESMPESSANIGGLYFAVATALMKQGQDEEAWEYLEKAHKELKEQSPYNPQHHEQKLQRIKAVFGRNYFADPELVTAEPDAGVQPIFIVGMPRSGVTLVEQVLASHSQIAARGELYVLESVLNQVPQKYGVEKEYPEVLESIHEQMLQEMKEKYYKALLRGAPQGVRFITDKNPFNFFRLGAVCQLFPQGKIIHCTRNPMDVCLSVYTNKLDARLNWAHDLSEIAHYYRQYRATMEYWEEILPEGRIFNLSYEAMVKNLKARTTAMLEFLGLEWEESCQNFYENSRSVAAASIWQVRQPMYNDSIGKWRRYEKELHPFISGIGDDAGGWE